MRRLFLLTYFTLLLYCCNGTKQDKTKIADASNRNEANQVETDTISETSKMMLISSGQFSPYKTILIKDCKFDLVSKDNDTIYLATKDKRFQTPEAYKVGTKFLELPGSVQSEMTKEPGWGYYYELPSGWSLGFCEGNSCTDNYPESNSEVKWIFKRK